MFVRWWQIILVFVQLVKCTCVLLNRNCNDWSHLDYWDEVKRVWTRVVFILPISNYTVHLDFWVKLISHVSHLPGHTFQVSCTSGRSSLANKGIAISQRTFFENCMNNCKCQFKNAEQWSEFEKEWTFCDKMARMMTAWVWRNNEDKISHGNRKLLNFSWHYWGELIVWRQISNDSRFQFDEMNLLKILNAKSSGTNKRNSKTSLFIE